MADRSLCAQVAGHPLRTSTLLFAVLLLSACGADAPEPAGAEASTYELAGAAMGTTWNIKVTDFPEDVDRLALRDDLEALMVSSERALSTYLPGSDLSRFNANTSIDWISVSLELCTIVDIALELGRMSGGTFDVTVGPLVNLWGFGPEGARNDPPGAEQVTSALELTGHQQLEADCDRPALKKARPEVYVDLSAFAKGYTVDKLAYELNARGVSNYLVEIGGELRAHGLNASGKPWSIAIEEPRLSGRSVQTIVGLSDSGMATSGDYRNFFQHEDTLYSHTIDPRTGLPIAHDGASVTVVAESTGFADAMATALLVLGPDDGIEFAERHDIAALFLVRTESGIHERRSAQFETEVSTL
ncbi:MAG: FAD:protein FMN transferase [Pseudomonadota bacterium]